MRDFDKLWDYQHPEATEQKFRNVLTETTQDHENVDYIAELWTQIARTQGLQKKFSEAYETLDQVEHMLPERMTAARIRYLLERGRVFNSSSRQAEALPLFLEAWELGVQAGEDDYAVDAAHMLGIAESTPEKRMDWNLKALAHAEEKAEASRWLGSLYNNIGWAKVDAGELDDALDLFERAYAFRKLQGNPVSIFIAKWSIAKVLRLLNQVEKALEIQQELLLETDQSVEPDGYVYEEMAECLLLLHREAESKPHFSRAYEILSRDSWLTDHEAERIARLKELAV
ncbi:tetratricopeptide repeat protein [Paenibacillus dokdonensis]|uniref:tetratricopeptide repeat protein n=1 Tax=Paenibacillus dokdonensis TaxID=2567944 RepID=UPI0010A8F92B|nr:tetratricopeptide repeat protein [Paenibacillus dokdonensis]